MPETVSERSINTDVEPSRGPYGWGMSLSEFSGRTVLVVDDEPMVREVVTTYLSRDGLDVIEASDGAAALRAFEEKLPDLIVLDVILPELDGYSLLSDFRSRSNVPVIMLTARVGETARVRGLALAAGRCGGACLEDAAGKGVPLMMYVFSDGSVSSNGAIDNTPEGRGKGEWVSDNSSTAGSFFLVYNPTRRPTLIGANAAERAMHQQIGDMSSDGSVQRAATPAANNVNLLVNTVLLNYMALHGEQAQFGGLFPNHGLGNATLQDRLTAFTPIVSSFITNPV